MRLSPNLNIIVKAIEKASSFVSRDFMELENLQSNPASADKFANSCYRKVKKTLLEDLHKMRPQYDIVFADGEIVRGVGGTGFAEYVYKIIPIDGLENLTRANSDFTVAVALEHVGKDGKKEIISAAIGKVIGNEIYYCEKSGGAYVNNRRSRVSKRNATENLVIFSDNRDAAAKIFPNKKLSFRDYGCRTLSLAYAGCGKIDGAIFNNTGDEFTKAFLLLIKEAGGSLTENDGYVFTKLG